VRPRGDTLDVQWVVLAAVDRLGIPLSVARVAN
jgi:hypothetical protein